MGAEKVDERFQQDVVAAGVDAEVHHKLVEETRVGNRAHTVCQVRDGPVRGDIPDVVELQVDQVRRVAVGEPVVSCSRMEVRGRPRPFYRRPRDAPKRNVDGDQISPGSKSQVLRFPSGARVRTGISSI